MANLKPYGHPARNGRLADGSRTRDTFTIPGGLDFCNKCKKLIRGEPVKIHGIRLCERCARAFPE